MVDTSFNQSVKFVTLSMVPEKYRKSFAKFDTDGDGILTSYNRKGEDEISNMSQKKGISLMENAKEAYAIFTGARKYGDKNSQGQYNNKYRNNTIFTRIIDKSGKEIMNVSINVESEFGYAENGKVISRTSNDDNYRNCIESTMQKALKDISTYTQIFQKFNYENYYAVVNKLKQEENSTVLINEYDLAQNTKLSDINE